MRQRILELVGDVLGEGVIYSLMRMILNCNED